MRVLGAGASVLLVAAAVLAVPTAAAAAPAPDLCAVDEARGAVPPEFVLDACVDAGAITVRNQLDVPVTVQATGDLGVPEWRVIAPGPVHAFARQLTSVPVLAPGDVLRWPRGAGAGDLLVGELEQVAALPVRSALQPLFPGSADLTALATELGGALAARAECVPGRSVIERVACDPFFYTHLTLPTQGIV
ncbi:hypothetical protein [Blastococcus atacamensis]|uniref:hypothetical protein n=1 Tax=Blastococcus atacamensis TaxID=2070508 RepID=UPI000CEBDEEE|nr:hypothetical protein [Blastococcus atacamensis]